MSDMITIDAQYMHKFSPKEIFQLFLNNLWKPGYEDRIYYANAKEGFEDAHYGDINDFSLEEFVNGHDANDPIRIDLRRGRFYGTFIIYEDSLSIVVGDALYMEEWPIPDFSWYLKELIFFFDYAGVRQYTCQV